ncbi:hypothetical protein K443DRAFT_104732, partial [Laccaria amethystina LaAM-08-1]
LPLASVLFNPLFAAPTLEATHSTLSHVELGSRHVLAFKMPLPNVCVLAHDL